MVRNILVSFVGRRIIIMNNVCIIRSNPVSPDSRVEKEAFSLVRNGFNVHILAWDRSKNGITENVISVADVIVPITRIGVKGSYGERFKNIKARFKFVHLMRKWIKENISKFDIIHACDFDIAFFCIDITKHNKKKFVFDMFDTVCSDITNPFNWLLHKAELSIVRKSNATILCTEERIEQIRPVIPQKLVIIHNTPFQDLIFNDEVISLAHDNEKIKIVYVGILQDGRLLKEIAQFFVKNSKYEFYIGGFGKYERYFMELASKYDNIHFLGKLPYSKTLSLESQCDIMLAIYDPRIGNHRLAAPNKFYEGLMLGKPLIMVKNTGMSDVIEKNELGELIDYSLSGFERGLLALIDKKENWTEMSIRMKCLYQEKYSWAEMEKRLVNLYREL